jgi:hypothetical protein
VICGSTVASGWAVCGVMGFLPSVPGHDLFRDRGDGTCRWVWVLVCPIILGIAELVFLCILVGCLILPVVRWRRRSVARRASS